MSKKVERRGGHTEAPRRRASGTMPAGDASREDEALDDAHLAHEPGAEKRLRTVVSNAPIILISTDHDGVITFSDGRGLRSVGLAPGQLNGQSAIELYGSIQLVDDRGARMDGGVAFRRVLAGDQVRALAHVADVVFDTRLMPLYGGASGSEIIGSIGVGTDVTERVRAEEALRAHEERLAATLDSIGEAVISSDASGSVRHMNPAAERLTGWTSPEAEGKPVNEVVRLRGGSAGDAIDDLEALAPRSSSRATTLAHAMLSTKLGVLRPVTATWARIADPRGGIVVTLRDTADERLAVQALQRSEASFRMLIESSPEMILIHRDERIVYVNRTLQAKLGYEQDELLGRHAFDLVHADDRDGVVSRTAKLGETGGATTPNAVRFVKKDGTVIMAENVAIRLEFDGFPAVVVIGRDVTERNAIQQELLRVDRMASLGTLSAGVAHEINNPLTYVLVNLEHVIRRLRASTADDSTSRLTELPPLIDALGQALEGATRVRQIVRDLMTFSRGHVDAKGLVDVHRVLEASLQMTTHELRHRARVEKHFRDVPPVEANEARLGQVFLNLLVNAAHAIPEGDVSKHVVTVATSLDDQGWIVIEIADTGEGIPPRLLSRIFDPFFTTRPTGGGSGLGLAISQGIIKSFGGDLTVESEEGKGTRFRVLLPPAPGYRSTRSSSTPMPVGVVRRRVLVIDDDRHVGDAIALSLKDEHDVDVLTDGRAALDRLAAGERYDVILCDLMMPEMTGMDFYREVLRVAPQLVSRLVFMSGGAFTPRARAFVEGVPNRCIEKPPEVSKLRELVRRRGA
jgi:PAS domain S-box-containing protein